MRQFDFYEFAGVLVPGTTLLFGVTVCVPAVKDSVFDQALTIGEATLSLIAVYGLGHLNQAAGNCIETALWAARRGWPTNWPRSRQHHLLSDGQVAELDRRVVNALNVDTPGGFQELSEQDWGPIVRQIYAAVAGCDRAQRVDTFNGNYGLNRGLAAPHAAGSGDCARLLGRGRCWAQKLGPLDPRPT